MSPPPVIEKLVVAHYMLGLTHLQTRKEWEADIHAARDMGIDGFALNIGRDDSWNLEQLDLAFRGEDALSTRQGFRLFLSFDMADPGQPWSVEQVVRYITMFARRRSYLRARDGRAVVSTFEGTGWADNWPDCEDAAQGIFLVPAWTSLGPQGVEKKLDMIVGAFNWACWPEAGSKTMTADADEAYRRILGNDKAYMMGASPWFYTNLPQYSKNWAPTCTTLWFDRWAQVLAENPDLVQIVTWNDYGESSYLTTPPRPGGGHPRHRQIIVAGAERYVVECDHRAFGRVVRYFARMFKMGLYDGAADALALAREDEQCLVAWYRTDVIGVGADEDGTVWGEFGTSPASHGTDDVISIIVIHDTPKPVTVSFGNPEISRPMPARHAAATTIAEPIRSVGSAHLYVVPIQGRVGEVTVSMGRGSSGQGRAWRTVTGPAIRRRKGGKVNFNVVTIGC
ncbi:glycoside hydrolase [Microdochium trichocladiopsis]|uniref:Glycoside hydrolase n=1 Tax=Microdochium trichocladiopsis TaxID=1682393 RepID=A0A9P8XVM4_9PEZI|nr:glycoside hydrolase [Microdochium trichocladiopsis]KAH7020782.1 glycoside hydrolase [Microdochium trichocladiopsis]